MSIYLISPFVGVDVCENYHYYCGGGVCRSLGAVYLPHAYKFLIS